MPARRARFAEPKTPLLPAVRAALAARGVSHLFLHQALAVDAILAGAGPVARQDGMQHHATGRHVYDGGQAAGPLSWLQSSSLL